MNAIRTMLVEDHEITRIGIRKMLESIPELTVEAECHDGRNAIDKARAINPDLILMDIGLPGIDGIQATRTIKESLATKVILISSHDNEEDVLAGLSAGADAYCLKSITVEQLTSAIHSVMDNALWIDPGIAKMIVQAATRAPEIKNSTAPQASSDKYGLTARELAVLCLLVEGASNQEIATSLFVSPETIKTHMRHIMEKLLVSDRTQAAVKAVRQGLV